MTCGFLHPGVNYTGGRGRNAKRRYIMKCPVCGVGMIERDFGGVKVDVCESGCKGIWFDWFELMKLDEKNEGLGAELKKALEYPRVNDEGRAKIKCPKCGLPMHIHAYQSSKAVNVDECYNCGGFFLDSGELRTVRETFMSDEDRENYVSELVKDIPEHEEALEDLEREKARNRAIDNFTRFLRIKHYI